MIYCTIIGNELEFPSRQVPNVSDGIVLPTGWKALLPPFLMGAGGHLRWEENSQLRKVMNDLIDGIESCAKSNGYIMGFSEEKLNMDEHPDYTLSWVSNY